MQCEIVRQNRPNFSNNLHRNTSAFLYIVEQIKDNVNSPKKISLCPSGGGTAHPAF